MRDKEKSKAQLIKDLSALRKQVNEFEDFQVGLLAEMTSPAIFIYQMNRVKYVNPAATKITGYNRDELLEMNLWEVIHPEFQELVKKRGVARQGGKKVPSRYEIKIQTKGGEERWVDYSSRVTTFEQNPAVLGTAVDITERKRTEEALLDNEERYRTLSEAAFEGMIISVGGKVVMANQAFADMFGYDSDEVIGLSPVEITTPESAERIMKNIQTSYEKPYEVIGVKKGGSTFNVEIMGKDCLYKSQKARVTAVRDITERKQGEDALRESESKFRVLAETTSAAIFIFQRNRMRYVNPAAANITGYTQDELLKMNFWQVIHSDFRSLVKERGLARQKGKKVRKRFEVKILTKNGEERWVDFTASSTEFNQKPAVLGTAVDITDRKNAQVLLQESESRFRALIEHGNDVTVMFDAEGKVSYISPSVKKVIGYEVDELVGQPGLHLVHPDDRERADKIFAEALLNSGKEVQFCHRMRHKNGSYITIEGTGTNLLTEPGVQAIVSNFRDITERKRAEEQLAGLKSFYEQLLEHLPIQLGVLDRDFRYSYVNPHGIKDAKMRKWMIGKTDLDYCRKRGLDLKIGRQRQKWYKNVISSKKSSSYEETLQTASGEERHFLRVASPVIEPNGDVIKIVGYGLNITENKLAEKELQKSLSLVRSTLESTADGILVVDQHGKIVSFNQKFLKMWHIPDSMIASHDDDKVIAFVLNQLKEPEEFLTQVRRLYNEPEAKGFDILSFKDGRIFERYSLAQRIGDKIVGRVWSFRDITEGKKIEAQLLQSQKMETIGTLAGGVAHDFNNILTAIVGNAELGMQSLDSDHRAYDDLFEIKKAAIKASDLTNQLLSFSRRQLLKKQSFDLNKVVEDLLKMLKRILGEDIELKTELAPSLPPVFADKGQIHQVLMNLFTNARDAMPEGGKLLLETRFLETGPLSEPKNGETVNNKTYLQLSVTDTGIGMSRELQAHIFEPFFTTKKLGKGTGLGLAVVYGIVEQHNGYLKVESEIDKGTTIKIFLPVATKRQEKQRKVKNKLNTWQGGSETILIVEDEEIVRNVAVRLINGLGYKVLLAKNGEEAMEIFNPEKNSIDLVVMDVVMPKESGPEIYKKMNAINPKLPVLFVTGYDAESKVSNLTQDFNQASIALLQKPYSKEILGRKIREMLDK